MKFRARLAVWACKFTRAVLRKLGKGGTAFPGKVALRICPNVLSVLAKDVKTLMVTGTNGKTTSARMIEQMFTDQGLPYFANRSGANLITGITAEFAANAGRGGRPRKSYAIIECDEAASKQVTECIKPKVILITNVFRDQLDRFGEVTHTLDSIKIGVSKAPEAKLCLNADCSLTASVQGGNGNEKIYFGVNQPIYSGQIAEVSDAMHCIRCKAEYEYDYITYGHLGGFRCPECEYRRPEPQIAVSGILEQKMDSTVVELTVYGAPFEAEINLPGGYNIYNAAGAVAAATAMGLPAEAAVGSLSSFQCGFGRMEKFQMEGAPVRMILVKNPAGCNQVLNFMSETGEETLFAVCLNDKTADGTDISWIWDVNFETLAQMEESLTGVLVSGIRRDDMALRLKYAGLPPEKIRVIPDYGELLSIVANQDKPAIIMPTYTAMLQLREKISSKYGYKDFWE